MRTSLQSRLLINRDFAWLWAAQASSSVGEYLLASTVTVWLITDLAAGQPLMPALVAAVVMTSTLPRLVVAPLVGVLVDRLPARSVMIAADLARLVMVLPMLAIAAFAEPAVVIVAILAVLSVIGVASQFFLPARAGSLQVVLPEDRRADGAGTMAFASMGVAVVATAAGPALYALAGPLPSLMVHALMFALSAICVARVQAAATARPDGSVSRRYWPDFVVSLLRCARRRSVPC